MATTSVTGLFSGLDSTSIIAKLVSLDLAPIATYKQQQTDLLDQSDAYTAINTSLNKLSTDLQTLSDPAFFRALTSATSNAAVGTATVDNTAANVSATSVSINVTQLSTQSVFKSAKSTPLSGAGSFDPSVPLSNATSAGGLGSGILDSTGQAIFTVSQASGSPSTTTITINSGTTLNDVVSQLNTAFGSGFASYNSTTGKIELNPNSAGGGSLTLTTQSGSFLQAAQLFNPPNLQTSSFANGTTATSSAASYVSGLGGALIINGLTVDLSGATDFNSVVATLNNASITAQTNVQANFVTDTSGSTHLVFQSLNGSPISIKDNSANDLVANGKVSAAGAYVSGTSDALISSVNALGSRDTSATVSGSDVGSFTINGVTINIAATDTLQSVLSTITNSTAGVVATYDSYNDQITFTSKTKGNAAINIANGSGNFASDYGLTASGTSFTAGLSTLYTVNGGASRVSADNSLTSSELGVNGLSFNATSIGQTTVTIGADLNNIGAGINNFIADYNATQNLLDSYTSVNLTDQTKSGILSNDTTINSLPNLLRRIVGGVFATAAGNSLDIGVDGNGSDNTLTGIDTSKLQALLDSNPTGVAGIFNDPTTGLVSLLTNTLDAYSGPVNSILSYTQTSFNNQVQSLNDQIARTQAAADAEQTYLESAFGAVDAASAQATQTASYLASFGGSNTSKN